MTNLYVQDLSPGELADHYGAVKAEMAALEKQLKAYGDEMKARGGRFEGERYDATVTTFTQERLDIQAAKAKLSAQFLRAHTHESEVTQIRVTAKQLRVAA